MPGILPMKVIKVGNSAQSRIAQACDRCRSKKIRCDGTRPTCSQCATVGFECRTSDKLSRRAFPRGYTESLEERVRALETENRELKDLLDEKDEKIDMLSRMHGNRQGSVQERRLSSSSASGARSPLDVRSSPVAKEDTFRVKASSLLLGVENSDSFVMGPSSGRSFIESFKRKLQECGKPCNDFNPDAFLHIQGTPPIKSDDLSQSVRIPPRMFSDRCVNVYFQEWAPLFPILHKPTFLRTYEDFSSDPAKIKSNHKLTQLHLVFSIAGLSTDAPDFPQLAACERQWTKALETIAMDGTMSALQCLLLAVLYYTIRADHQRLQHYKALAVTLSHRLGLHQSQKRFAFGALTTETRKKVFWTLYTLDCFTAATLGLPKLLKEVDVQAEYPADTDDEYVTEKGFQPTLPGESTRVSNALALFRGARILGRVLETIYPTASAYDLSLPQMFELETELDNWYNNLPSHLRLTFKQDKPSTDVTGSRSPILALVYYHIRTLIYRPALGSSLGPKAAPAVLSIGDSSKRIIQILQLLEERNMSFSFCLNRSDMLTLCGMSLLYRTLDLKQDGRLIREDERLVNTVLKMLSSNDCSNSAAGTAAFAHIAGILVNVEVSSPSLAVQSSMSSPSAPQRRKKLLGRSSRLASVATASESDLLQQQEKLRRMTMPGSMTQRPDLYRTVPSRQSFDCLPTEKLISPASQRNSMENRPKPNLDYLSFNGDSTPERSHPSSPPQIRLPGSTHPNMVRTSELDDAQIAAKVSTVSSSEWEAILGSMDNGITNVYDAIYGGPALVESIAPPSVGEWSPDAWDLANFTLGGGGAVSENYAPGGNGMDGGGPAAPQSVLSLSDESLSSGEEIGPSEMGMSSGYSQMMGPGVGNDGFTMESFENFVL